LRNNELVAAVSLALLSLGSKPTDIQLGIVVVRTFVTAVANGAPSVWVQFA
jgi:hypothetical protein